LKHFKVAPSIPNPFKQTLAAICRKKLNERSGQKPHREAFLKEEHESG